MALTAKQAFKELSRPGPHRVMRGDLALVGLPGAVLTPESGKGLPAVVFGHGWLQPIKRYHGFMRHLASWGFVVAAPATQTGPLPSHRLFTADMRTALDVCTSVRLGEGRISVNPEQLGMSGHSLGGGCAVLASAEDERVRAVGTMGLSETRPSAIDAARECAMPALHLSGDEDLISPPIGHAEPVAQAWAGPVQLRGIDKATHLGFTENWQWTDLLLDGKPQSKTQKISRILLTAFFLRVLTGNRKYSALLEEEIKGCSIDYTRGPAIPSLA